MPIPVGTHLGPYEILAPLGVGGMGEVYRARDTRLGREVAIKVLPERFAADAERVARFQREAQLLASLNHPNIAIIHGLEEGPVSSRALVMELVEGPTLAERIAHGAIPLDEALPVASQIADALEAAHERGIIHRDLKPANIKVRPDGTVKVLDFGLAKLNDPNGSNDPNVPNASQSPTLSVQATMAGTILGTAAYMSPEQARGKPVDRRADIWAFGCVLYEMLAGKQTFAAGETISDAVAAILKNEPDWSALPADTPDQIRTLLRRCLQKDVQKRLPHIGVARMEIEETLVAAADGARNPSYRVADPTSRMSRRRERLAWTAVVAIVALAAGALALTLRPVSPLLETRVDISTPPTTDPFSFAISPDGRRVVFAVSEDGRPQLWLRSLDNETPLPVQGTEGAALPFWSPDSRSMAFFADGVLKRVELSGGQPQTLAPAANPRGGTWGEEGVILFAALGDGSILRVPATGGETAEVTALATGQFGHRFPEFLPGSRQFLFHASGIQGSSGIYLGSLDGSEVARLTEADTVGRYASPGWLLFIRQGTLVAQRFDRSRGVLTGDPARVAEDVAVNADQNGAFSASAAGPLVLRAGEPSPRQLTWFDRGGNTLGVMGAPDGTQVEVVLAPDGRRVAIQRTVRGNGDIWLIDAARTTRFTFAENVDLLPLWSPDGSRLAFSRNQGTLDVFEKSSSGAGTEQLLLKRGSPLDWSPDGRFLLYSFIPGVTGAGQDQWVLPMDGDRKPFAFSNTPFNERLGQFSPDGRWVAYQSDESGRHEVYVRPFPGPGGQWQISAAGGITPRWRADGRELFYIAPDSTLMAAPVAVNDTALEPGVPTALFRPRIFGGGTNPIGTRWQYDVAPDGRFLINVETEEASVSPITLILNWKPEQ